MGGGPRPLRSSIRAPLSSRIRLPPGGLTRALREEARASGLHHGRVFALALGLIFFYAPLEAGPGLHPEDLLPARADGDRRARRLRRRAACSRSSTCARATASGTCAPTSRSTCRSSSAVGVLITGAIWAKASWGHWWLLGRADAGLVPDHLPPVLLLPAAALLDRGPRAPGPLRQRVRDHRGRVRAGQLHRRPAGRGQYTAPARAVGDRRVDARRDAADVPRLAAWR